MRIIPCLVLFVGLVTSEYAWTPGKEYEFLYKSRAITAIPGIRERLSGMGIRSKVIVQPLTENELLVKMYEVAVAELKNTEAPHAHWRKELPLSYTPLAEEFAQPIAMPFKLYLRGGQVEAIQTTPQEPAWVMNIKKALATQLSVNVAKVRQAPLKTDTHVQENMITQVNKNFYVVEEDSIAGECRTEYTLVPLPKYLAEREAASLPEPIFKRAREEPVFLLTKTRDYDQCQKKPSFVQISRPDMTHLPCRPTDTLCKKFSSRTSVSRYLLAGIPNNRFEILRVWTEGEVIVRPAATNTEAIYTVSNQTLTLQVVEPIRNPLPRNIEGPRDSLTFRSPEIAKPSSNPMERMERPERYMSDEPMSPEYRRFQPFHSRPHYPNRMPRYVEEPRDITRNEEPQPYPYPRPEYDPESPRSEYPPRPYSPRSEYEPRPYPRPEYEPRPYSPRSEYDPRPFSPRSEYEPRPYSPRPFDLPMYKRMMLGDNWSFIPRPCYPTLMIRPTYLHPHSYMESIPVPKIRSEIKELLMEVEQTIETFERLSEKEPSLKISKIAQLISMLSYEEIEHVYREIAVETPRVGKTMKYLFLDAVAMSGTNPAIMFIKEKIEKKEIRGERAAQLIMVIPVSIKTPTPEILQELVRLAQKVEGERQVWMTTILAVSNILNRACINPTSRKTSYLYGPYGSPYCRPQEVEILLPYLVEKLESSSKPWKQSVVLQAIGNLGHPEVFPVLRPYVLGQRIQDPQLRAKAIFALHQLVHLRPNEVFALLKPVFTSPEEYSEVRMAAFTVILATRPPKTFFTETATQTWFEQSQQVASFVYSTFRNLANSSYPQHMNISRIASIVLPLTKPTMLGAQYSKNIFVTKFLPQEQLGSMFQYAHYGSPKSLIPKEIYTKLFNHLGGFDMPVLEMALQTQGLQELFNRVWGPHERTPIPTGLNIHARKDLPIEGSMYVKLFGSMQRYFTIETLQEMFLEGMVEFNGLKEAFVNYQKALPLQEDTIVMPLDIGMPAFITIRTPVMMSLRGKIEGSMEPSMFQLRRSQYPRMIKFFADVKPFISVNRIIESGIICPLSRTIYSAGVNNHMLVTMPGKLEVVYNKNELEVIVKPTETHLPSEIEIVQYSRRPYVAAQPFYSARQHKTYITVQQRPTERREVIGRRPFGLAFDLISRVDQPYNTFSGIYHDLVKHSVLSASQFLFVPQRTLRASEYKVVLRVPESETREMKARVIFGVSESEYPISEMKYEREMEKKYYKHPSPHYPETERYFKKFYDNPMPECQDPESPCYEAMKVLNVRSTRQRQEIMGNPDMEVPNAPVRHVHAEIEFRGRQPRIYRGSMVMARNPINTQQKVSMTFEREASPSLRPYRICVNGMLKFPVFPSESRRVLLETPKTTLGHLEVGFGPSCQESQIRTKIVMGQTEEQRQQAERSEEARECAQYEAQGLKYIDVCRRARRQATLLNNYIVDIEGKNIPRPLRNITYQLDDLVKYMLYPHMSNKRVEIENPANRVRIVMTIPPQKISRPFNVFDIFMYKPRENTFYSIVESNLLTDYLMPINAKTPVVRRTMNKILGGQYTPTCKLQGQDWITTFDNVTYRYPIKECYHLVAKDCSKVVPVQVMAKESGEKKSIKIEFGKHIVEIHSREQITLDGQPIVPQLKEIYPIVKDSRPALIVRRLPTKTLEVRLPIHGLTLQYEGKYVAIQMSNRYRGRLCGLCGDFNMEKTAEYRTPEECVVSSPEVFGQTWALGSCKRTVSPSECTPYSRGRASYYGPSPSRYGMEPEYPSRFQQRSPMRFPDPMSYSPRMPQVPEPRPLRETCTRYIHKVHHRGDETCFSVKPIPECHLKCKHSGEMEKTIGFHCLQHGRVAKDMMARAMMGPIEELYEKPVDFRHEIRLPESCVEA